jgi:hypothetical protein
LVKPARTKASIMASALHGLVGRQMLPRIGPEMVAAQNDARRSKPTRAAMSSTKSAEVGWRHAGIAAILIDLVAGGFDQHGRSGRDAARAASIDQGWAEQIDVMPTGRPAANAARHCSEVLVHAHAVPWMRGSASISAMVGGALHRALDADCPCAGGVGDDQGLAAAMPRSQKVTKAPPKQSPAPVGSTSATLKPGEDFSGCVEIAGAVRARA